MANKLEAHLRSQHDTALDFFWHRVRWAFVRKHLPYTAGTVLDVGAGAGVIGDYVARDCPNLCYLFDEPIPSLRANLRERFGAEADRHDASSFASTDAVLLLDVIEHIDDDKRFLQDLIEKLETDTVIIVTVPASMRYWSVWDVNLGHYRRYAKRDLEALLGKLPVRVTAVGRLFPEMVPAALWRAYRHPSNSTGEPTAAQESSDTEFPQLPKWLNKGLYATGLVGVWMKGRIPFGTSLFAVMHVTNSAHGHDHDVL